MANSGVNQKQLQQQMNPETNHSKLIIKVCGTTNLENALAVAKEQPSMMGFILYPKSKRYVHFTDAQHIASHIPKSIKRVAVLVNESIETAIEISESGVFDYIQLHGNESPEYCQRLATYSPIIKAFGIENTLPENLNEYGKYCSFLLFDTKSNSYGGTGEKFDHQILNDYSLNVPFLLSGGIDIEDACAILANKPTAMAGIDVNSKFEVVPGVKVAEKIGKLIKEVKQCIKR